MRFTVDLLNNSNVKIGSGPLSNVLSASVTESLDEAGTVSIVVPATDTQAIAMIGTAKRLKVVSSDGLTAIGLIRERRIQAGNTPTLEISGPDLIGDLARFNCLWYARFKAEDINSTVIPALIAGTGFTSGTIDAALGNYTGVLFGDSRLTALQKVREQIGKHFRQGATPSTLDFGAFGVASGYRFIRADTLRPEQETNTDIGIISGVEETIDAWNVATRIFPWGAGEDDGAAVYQKVTLEDLWTSGAWNARAANVKVTAGIRGTSTTVAAGSSYGSGTTSVKVASSTGFAVNDLVFIGVKSGINGHDASPLGARMIVTSIPDSTHLNFLDLNFLSWLTTGLDVVSWPQYYIEDVTEYAADPREVSIVFSDIDLPDRSHADQAGVNYWNKAAIALYDRAYAYLQNHKVAQKTYTFEIVNVPIDLRVGDTVRFVYRGVVTNSGVAANWIDVDADFYVLVITRTYNANGSAAGSLTLSNLARSRNGDRRYFGDLSNDVNIIKATN